MDCDAREVLSSQTDSTPQTQLTNVVVTCSNLSQINLTVPVDYNKISDLRTYVVQSSNEHSSDVN